MGYNLFNSNDEFYTDICTPFTSINNTDILLIDWKNDIYNKYANISVCQENCNLESYNENSNTVSCYYNAQSNDTKIDLNIDKKFNLKTMTDSFYNYLNNSNFRVLKCYKVAIDLTTIIQNIGRIIMTIILLVFIILFIIFLVKGNAQINLYLKKILDNIFELNENKKNIKDKNNKILNIKSKNIKNKKKKKNKINNNKKDSLKKSNNKKIKVNPSKKTKTKIKINEKKNYENNIKETNNLKNKKNFKDYKKKINFVS